MDRVILHDLNDWLSSKARKPLVLRGARQVGKTWVVRRLAEQSGRHLIELNFEKTPSLAGLFSSNDPKQILLNLSAVFKKTIIPEQALLFLDEIQAAPDLLAKLRWFYEELPELPVIAAGSLLEFVLANHSFSMPVGRITYRHLEPLSFEEFLLAAGQQGLYDYLQSYDIKTAIPPVIHEQFMASFKEYVFVGGLPAAVASWISHRSLEQLSETHYDLLATYRDDFSKYGGRLALDQMDEVLLSVPKMLAQKFMFSRASDSVVSEVMKRTLSLFEKSRIIHRVKGCSANGVPLEAELKDKYFKMIFFDTGLCCAALGINLHQITSLSDLNVINRGGLSEQVVGQLLRPLFPFYIEPKLYCWHRDEKGSSAEIDYIIQHENKVIPIEVKSGSTGSLKSLHLFMALKKSAMAVRLNSDFPSITPVEVKDATGQLIKYTLLSIPFYLMGQLHRLLAVLR